MRGRSARSRSRPGALTCLSLPPSSVLDGKFSTAPALELKTMRSRAHQPVTRAAPCVLPSHEPSPDPLQVFVRPVRYITEELLDLDCQEEYIIPRPTGEQLQEGSTYAKGPIYCCLLMCSLDVAIATCYHRYLLRRMRWSPKHPVLWTPDRSTTARATRRSQPHRVKLPDRWPGSDFTCRACVKFKRLCIYHTAWSTQYDSRNKLLHTLR